MQECRDCVNSTKIIVALDFADAASALALVERLDPALCRLKVGKELFTAGGAGAGARRWWRAASRFFST